jgi:para-aminobenzoate synthetase component 1
LAEELVASEKERAENVMIVDLLRNDLGRVCSTGSVRVPHLFDIEPHPRVWHLVSTVTGELAPGRDFVDLLRASFPGGSVTGAPKIRAMEIIEEFEPVRRGIYCGAIGYFSFSGTMSTSIVIRTIIIAGGRLYLQVGGAIMADSDPVAEYEETWHKARGLLDALGQDG